MQVPFRTRLFDKPPTNSQIAVALLWASNLAVVIYIWILSSGQLLGSGPEGIMLSLGRLTGLLATYFALMQFLLMGRVLWIERPFGLDRLATLHRLNGYAAFIAILLHPFFIVSAYSLSSRNPIWTQYAEMLRSFPYVWLAFIAQILFILVVVSSIYIVRRKLRFESWYWVHMTVYAAIVLASFHQFALGGSLLSEPWMRGYWYLLYTFLALNVLFYRFSLPSLNLARFRFKISRVVAETPSTTSVYITGKGLSGWKAKPGQFVLIRFLQSGYWTEEHPFSLSAMPTKDTIRLTIRHAGDFTSRLPSLKAGSYTLISGPFGRFTDDTTLTDKRLFIAGGVGITPIRTLAEQALERGLDSQLLYASRSSDDIIFRREINQLAKLGLRVRHFVSEDNTGAADIEQGRLTAARIAELVPDFAERDIFICGPPPLMAALLTDLTALGVLKERLHYEEYSLHT